MGFLRRRQCLAGSRRAGVPEATAGRDRADFGDDASGRLEIRAAEPLKRRELLRGS